MKLRRSITTYNNLPITGNFIGDVRKVIDTSSFYIWMSQSSADDISNWNLLAVSAGILLESLFELDFANDLQPIDSPTVDKGVIDVDINLDLMPSSGIELDTYLELDGNNDIMPKI